MFEEEQIDEAPDIGSDDDAELRPSRRNDIPAPSAKSVVEPTADSNAKRQGDAKSSRRSRLGLRSALALAALVALGSGGYYGYYWWTVGSYFVTTDDAYVGSHGAVLSPKVAGYISEIDVPDNARLKPGDVFARIDDGDYKLAVQSARDQITSQQAMIERIGRQMTAQSASVDQAKAKLTSAQAGETRAQLELKRQKDLAARDFASKQKLEQARADFQQATASVRSAQAGIEAANANVEVLKAQQEEAKRTLAMYRTQLAKAERDLSFTVIRAPFEGVVGNRAIQVGDYVQPAQRLASLVPLNTVYVDANFKETQLARVHPGQPVTISVDALPGREIKGWVESIAPASGSVFSLLPPDNATGNFTKIVQRLPVRIALPAKVTEQSLLRPGMSVTASVNTKDGARAAVQATSELKVRSAVRQAKQ